jgi:hypothetical protein
MSTFMLLGLVLALGRVPGVPARDTVPPTLLKARVPAAPEQAGPQYGVALVLLQAEVNTEGGVANVRTLQAAAPFTTVLRDAVASFRFAPARAGESTRAARVLVAGYFRPPRLVLQGEALPKTPAADAPQAPEAEVPWPTTVVPPAYPATAVGDAVVVVDLVVDERGQVIGGHVIDTPEAAPGAAFESVALQAARDWTFRLPDDGPACPCAVVIVFTFRAPQDIGQP